MIRPVLRMGDPRLLRRSRAVEKLDTPELHGLIGDMRDTMAHLSGAGLAAPQIGVDLRVVIFGCDVNPRYPDADAVPFTVLVNPQISPLTPDEEDGWEGCLSVPGMRGVVPRWQAISYRGVDERGHEIVRRATGFHARVVQHECDHLDGILYPMRVRDFSRFGFIDALFADGQVPDEA